MRPAPTDWASEIACVTAFAESFEEAGNGAKGAGNAGAGGGGEAEPGAANAEAEGPIDLGRVVAGVEDPGGEGEPELNRWEIRAR